MYIHPNLYTYHTYVLGGLIRTYCVRYLKKIRTNKDILLKKIRTNKDILCTYVHKYIHAYMLCS